MRMNYLARINWNQKTKFYKKNKKSNFIKKIKSEK